MTAARALDCETARRQAAAYVLGALDAATAEAVRRHLATCREPHPEFAELGGAVAYLAEVPDPVEPPAGLRARILAAAAADVEADRRESAAASRLVSAVGSRRRERGTPEPEEARPPAEAFASPAGEVAALETISGASPHPDASARATPGPARRTRRVSTWLLAAAAVVALVALGVGDLSLRQQLQTADSRAAELRDVVRQAALPGVLSIRLAGSAQAPGAAGLALVSPTGSGYVVVHGLPPAPAGRTYEAWFIAGGSPRPAGLFQIGNDGLGILSGLRPGGAVDAVAVTQENAAGARQPTGPILVSGNAGA